MKLLPRETKFYPLFQKQVDLIAQASQLLLEGMRMGINRMAGAATDIVVLDRKSVV